MPAPKLNVSKIGLNNDGEIARAAQSYAEDVRARLQAGFTEMLGPLAKPETKRRVLASVERMDLPAFAALRERDARAAGAAGQRLRNAHNAGANQIKCVGLVAFFADDLPLIVRDELDILPEVLDELVAQRGKQRHAAQMICQRTFPIFFL